MIMMMMMCSMWMWVVLVAIAGALLVLRSILKNVNWWLYESKLGVKQYSLPPGDMGWPFIGNMWSFLSAFKSKDPDSFISSFVSSRNPNTPQRVNGSRDPPLTSGH
ncbi:hypothetical protein JHK85_024419 [Glycine max]|nr:hypothetical protein JHK85_024419 [Glycine max]